MGGSRGSAGPAGLMFASCTRVMAPADAGKTDKGSYAAAELMTGFTDTEAMRVPQLCKHKNSATKGAAAEQHCNYSHKLPASLPPCKPLHKRVFVVALLRFLRVFCTGLTRLSGIANLSARSDALCGDVAYQVRGSKL